MTPPNGEPERARTPRAPRPKRLYLLMAGVVLVGGGALFELVTGALVLGVLELIVAACVAVGVIDSEHRRRSPRR